MRARLALTLCNISVELREITLRNKPASMLALSPKGTVPVLQLIDGQVIDESWDIIQWASQQNDPLNLRGTTEQLNKTNELIAQNDASFKTHLDHYKYADRFPDYPAEHYRSEAEAFLQTLEDLLTQHTFLLGHQKTLADIGIFPFIRQFAHVDIDWFRQTPYPQLIQWMDNFLSDDAFIHIMQKHSPWSPSDTTKFL